MAPPVKKPRKVPPARHAEKALAAVLVVSVISTAAVLISLFFVLSTMYSDTGVVSDDFQEVIKEFITVIFGNE